MERTFYDMLMGCKNIKAIGVYEDPEGQFPPMPLFELAEETAEEWNRQCEEQRRRNGKDKNRAKNGNI